METVCICIYQCPGSLIGTSITVEVPKVFSLYADACRKPSGQHICPCSVLVPHLNSTQIIMFTSTLQISCRTCAPLTVEKWKQQ